MHPVKTVKGERWGEGGHTEPDKKFFQKYPLKGIPELLPIFISVLVAFVFVSVHANASANEM